MGHKYSRISETWKVPPCLAAYLNRVGAEVRNFSRYIIKREGRDHYHFDSIIITMDDDGEIECSDKDSAPSKEERHDIKVEFVALQEHERWPTSTPVRDTDELLTIIGQDAKLFAYSAQYPKDGKNILFVQERQFNKEGVKRDLPWSYWSDNQWRNMEPDGLLPLWGLDQLGAATTVFLHEGAKGAHTVSKPGFLKGHPWEKELTGYGFVHLGWPGGAPNAHRVDWKPIRDLQRHVKVIIVCDNDISGEKAASAISKRIQRNCWALRFGEVFGKHFDLADQFPPELWKDKKGVKVYDGPRLQDCLVNATWATRWNRHTEAFELREEFEEGWYSIVRPAVFVHRDRLDQRHSVEEFNKLCGPFSDVKDVAALLAPSHRAQAHGLVYEPARKSGRIALDGRQVVNVYRPSKIKPLPYNSGDDAPWLEFLDYLILDEQDREHVKHWCATLIARPEIRILYGLLLISEKHGVGKSTLAEGILAPLLGWSNCSAPSIQQIKKDYSTWRLFKRLAIIAELYSGHSSELYNNLKTIMTDPMIDSEEKYEKSYTVSNHIHLLASSNSMRALKLDDGDRRWFVPRVTEIKRDYAYWKTFYDWLGKDGLRIIMQWAINYVAQHGPVEEGKEAPLSARKGEVINAGYGDGERYVFQLGEQLAAIKDKTILRLDHVRAWLAEKKATEHPRQYGDDGRRYLETPELISKVLRRCGLHTSEQVKYKGDRFRYVANFPIDPNADWEKDLLPLLKTPTKIYALEPTEKEKEII